MRRPLVRATISTALAALTLSVPATASADEQQSTTFVDCTTGPVVINDNSVIYRLTGTCGDVVINASSVRVGLDSARHVVVTGNDVNLVSNVTTDSIEMHGSSNHLFAGTVGTLRLTGDHHTAYATGRLVKIHGKYNEVRYSSLDKLVVKGSHNTAHTRQGKTEVKVTGRHNKVKVHKRR